MRLERAILDYQSQIGERVDYAALAKLISAAEGRSPGFAKSTVSEWLAGRSEPRLATVKAIAKALNADLLWLAFGTQAPPDTRVGETSHTTATEVPRISPKKFRPATPPDNLRKQREG